MRVSDQYNFLFLQRKQGDLSEMTEGVNLYFSCPKTID